MRRLIIISTLLLGCGHQPGVKRYDVNWTRGNFCADESCPAFAGLHDYAILSTKYRPAEKDCECKLQSGNMPDPFYVFIPIDAPADSPVAY